MRAINWFGLVAGILTLVVIVISMFLPWWQLTIGDNLLTINASPIYTNFGLLGDSFTIPLLLAINISTILLFTAGGIVMLIYSFIPSKPYAKHLLGFSWKKPLYALIFFAVGLLATVGIAGYLGFNVPLMGTAAFSIPEQWTFGTGFNFNTQLTANFLIPFWLAVPTAILCVLARVYHSRIPEEGERGNMPPPPPPPI